ncbi:hypothetical protein J2W21_001598 [Sinomonas atrocyanea]|nr:hypothetical protein [Sinomonas atrocyanea]
MSHQRTGAPHPQRAAEGSPVAVHRAFPDVLVRRVK